MAHNGELPLPIWMKHPFRKGSVLEAFILTRKQVGEREESTARSSTPKCIDVEKAAELGTVNSADLRKPK